MIENLPTLKASNSPEKTTLPGRLQIFRGTGADGNYVADVIGLDDEAIEIPSAVRTERLLVPFWEHGRYHPIPSIKKQKAFVEEQRARFVDIDNYPCALSDRLRELRDGLTAKMREDHSGWKDVLSVPESLAAERAGKDKVH